MAAARQAILEAAARAFARHGFHGTTIDEVAREAGYSASSLYTYFKGKRELYSSLLEAVATQFETLRSGPTLPSLGFYEHLEWLIRRQFEIVEKNRDFFVIFASQRGGIEWVQDQECDSITRFNYLNWIGFMTEFFARGIEQEQVRASDPRDLAYFAVGAINASIFRWVAGDIPISLQDHAATLLEFLVSGLRHPVAGKIGSVA